MDWFARFMAYAQHCGSQPLGFPDCNALWGGLFLLALCLVGIAAIRLIYRTEEHTEQKAIEDIINRGQRPARESHRPHGGGGVDPGDAGSYEKMLGKIRDDAAKARDAYQ